MAEKSDNLLPIPEKEIQKYYSSLDTWLKELNFSPAGSNERVGIMTPEMKMLFAQYSKATGSGGMEKSSILSALERLSKDSKILSVHASKVVNTIKMGFAVGVTLMEQYEKASGITNLRALNKESRLTGDDVNKFQQGQMTAAAIELFASAYYIVWELSRYQSEEVSGRVVPEIQLPEFTIMNAQQAIKFALFYYGKFIESDKIVMDDVALVKFTIEYFNVILRELNIYRTSLKYTEEFESRSYKLGKTDFIVHGFHAELSQQIQNIEFVRVSFKDIVGNRANKHDSHRLIGATMCYDPKEQRNPMQELGGFTDVSLYEGPPGTGKGMTISAIATDLYDRCKDLKIPFAYWPFPPNPVSEYQGGSAQRVLDFFRVLRDPGKIFYAPIDDAENNLVSRGSRSISSGNREVIAIFLTETEGASAVKRGNYVIQLFTNRPEDLDAAVLSRIQKRSTMDGAVTWQDFMDQDYGWWRKYNKHKEGFITLKPADDYEYFKNQASVTSMNELYTGAANLEPTNLVVREIFHRLSNEYNPKVYDKFYGMFYAEVKKRFPFFTSRDLRNIQKNIETRIMDFDFPDEWMKDNAIFFAKKCDEKKQMLVDLMQENMQGISFAEVRTQEAIKYIDITVRINETKFETSVREQLEQMRVNEEAKKRFKAELEKQ
jgi:hypothetical protein